MVISGTSNLWGLGLDPWSLPLSRVFGFSWQEQQSNGTDSKLMPIVASLWNVCGSVLVLVLVSLVNNAVVVQMNMPQCVYIYSDLFLSAIAIWCHVHARFLATVQSILPFLTYDDYIEELLWRIRSMLMLLFLLLFLCCYCYYNTFYLFPTLQWRRDQNIIIKTLTLSSLLSSPPRNKLLFA